jgi:chromosome segregation ATPase
MEVYKALIQMDSPLQEWKEDVLYTDHIATLEAAGKEQTKESDYFRHELNVRTIQLSDANKQIAALEAAVKDKDEEINHPKRTYCAYCGYVVDIDDNAASKISEHIMSCELHPMRIYEKQIAALTAENQRWKEDVNQTEAALGISGLYARKDDQIDVLTADLKIANGGINTLDELIERKDKTISILTAENAKYREALESVKSIFLNPAPNMTKLGLEDCRAIAQAALKQTEGGKRNGQ